MEEKFKKYRKKSFPKKKNYFYKENPKTIKKFCPKGKKNCRCWLRSEEGHYANECPSRKQFPDKIKILEEIEKEGFYPIEIEFNSDEEYEKFQTEPNRTISIWFSSVSNRSSIKQLLKTKINFLGLEIDEGYHSPQPHILEHIQKFPNKIEDIKQLQRFLGILTYSENYIPGLAKIRAPLQSKLKKENPWNWTQENSVYVAKIKNKLSVFPKLYHPERNNL